MPADLGSLTARISLDTTPLAAGAAAAKGELSGLEASGSSSLTRLANVGKAAFLGLSVAGAAVSVVSLKMASDFQASMMMVRTQAGASQAEVNAMTDAVLRMASSVGTSPQALADALFHIESAGLRGAEALDVLRIAAMGAKVGNADLESVTNALVAVTTSHISGVHSQAEAMGVLNAIIGVGNMRMDDLAAAIGTGILPVARSFGLSLQDVGAAMAVMTDQAVPAEVAATRLRTTFALMAAPTTEAVKQLARLGISSTDLATAMRHGGIVEAIGLLRDRIAASGLSATEASQLLNKAFGGGETSGTILTLIGNFDSLVAKQKGIAEGAGKFSAAWEATKQTFKFQMDQMKASAEVLGIKIGNFLIPIVLQLVKALDGAVTWLGKHKDIALALAAVVGGPLLAAMLAFIATEIAAAAPVLAVGAAIGLLSGALVLAYQKIGPFHDALNAVASFLKSTFLAAVDKVRSVWAAFLDGFDRTEGITENLGGIEAKFAAFGAALKLTWDKIRSVWDAFTRGFTGEGITEHLDGVEAKFAAWGAALRQVLDKIRSVWLAFVDGFTGEGITENLNGVEAKFAAFGATVRRVFENVGPAVIAALNGIVSFITNSLIPGIQAAVRGIAGPLGDFVRYIREIAPQVQEAVRHIVEVIRRELALVAGVFAAVFVTIKAAWNQWGDDIMRIVRIVFDTVKAYIQTAVRVIRDIINGVLALINGDWGKAWNAFSDIPRAAFDLIKTLVGNAMKIIGNLFATGWDAISQAVPAAFAVMLDYFRSLPGRIIGAMGSLTGALVGAGRDLILGMLNGVAAGWTALVNWAQAVPGTLASWFAGSASWLVNAGRDLLYGFLNGVAVGWNGLVSWAQAVPGTLASWFSSSASWLLGAGREMLYGFLNGVAVGWNALVGWAQAVPGTLAAWFSASATWLFNAGIDLIKGFLNGMISALSFLPGIVQKFLGLDAVIRGLRGAVDMLDGAKVDITAHADTAAAQQALDDLAATIGGLVDYSHPPPPGAAMPAFAGGGLTHGPSLAGEKAQELVLPMNNLVRARQLLAAHGGAITGASGGSAGPTSQSSVTQYILSGPIMAADPAELERQLEARARVASMAGR